MFVLLISHENVIFHMLFSRPNFDIIEKGLNVLLSLVRSPDSGIGSHAGSHDFHDGSHFPDTQDFYSLLDRSRKLSQ